MLNLFVRRREEVGLAPLPDHFSVGEMSYECSSPAENLGPVRQRAKAEAISLEIRGRCTTSEMPAATNASAPLSSAEAVANRIGTSGTISCSATARSSADAAGARWPTSSASNRL